MFLVYLDVFIGIKAFGFDDDGNHRQVIHHHPVTAGCFSGDLDFRDGNLRRRPVAGFFDFRLDLFQIAVFKREHGVPLNGFTFLTHLSEHFPFQPCQ